MCDFFHISAEDKGEKSTDISSNIASVWSFSLSIWSDHRLENSRVMFISSLLIVHKCYDWSSKCCLVWIRLEVRQMPHWIWQIKMQYFFIIHLWYFIFYPSYVSRCMECKVEIRAFFLALSYINEQKQDCTCECYQNKCRGHFVMPVSDHQSFLHT